MPDSRISIGIIGAGIMGERLLRAILEQTPRPPARRRHLGPLPGSDGAHGRGLSDNSAPERCRGDHCSERLRLYRLAACVASRPCPRRARRRQSASSARSRSRSMSPMRRLRRWGRRQGRRQLSLRLLARCRLLKDWIAQGEIGTVSRIAIEVAFATWPRSWQADAASWLDKPAQGGFTREVVSHFLFLSRRLVGPLHGLKASVEFPEAGKVGTPDRRAAFAGDLPVDAHGQRRHHHARTITTSGCWKATRVRSGSATGRSPNAACPTAAGSAPLARCPMNRPARSPSSDSSKAS